MQLVFGPLSGQYRNAMSLAEEVKRAVGSAKLTFVGHSLGGGLASAAALRTGDPAVTFNAAGLNPFTRAWAGSLSGDRVSAYYVNGEQLTSLQLGSVAPDAAGIPLPLRPATADSDASGWDLHGMDYVLRAMGVQ